MDNAAEPMRRWLQEATLASRVFEESAGLLWSEEVTNTCALANDTGGKGVYNQWIHCDLIVIF